MMISVKLKDGESGEKLLRRFTRHVKNTRLQKKFRIDRFFAPKPTKTKQRASAISREAFRAENLKKKYSGAA